MQIFDQAAVGRAARRRQLGNGAGRIGQRRRMHGREASSAAEELRIERRRAVCKRVCGGCAGGAGREQRRVQRQALQQGCTLLAAGRAVVLVHQALEAAEQAKWSAGFAAWRAGLYTEQPKALRPHSWPDSSGQRSEPRRTAVAPLCS